MYFFGKIIVPSPFQLFIYSGLAKGDFLDYQLRNEDRKWTTKNRNQTKMNRESKIVEFEFTMLAKSRCFMVTVYMTAELLFKEASNSRLVTTAI